MEIAGRVDAVIMKNEENGFAILKVKPRGEGGTQHVSIKGPLSHINVGEEVECAGCWQSHLKYGWSFMVTDVNVTQPISHVGLVNYMEKTIPGVGPVLAQKIVARWGKDVFEVLDKDPHVLLEIKGVPKSKINNIIDVWEEKKGLREVVLFLSTHKVTANQADRFYKAYGKKTIEVLTNEPYRITELPHIGFLTADKIAQHIGYPLEGEARIDAGVQYLLGRAEEYGHVYSHVAKLLTSAKEDLEIRNTELVKERIEALTEQGLLVMDKLEYKHPRVYLREFYELEGEVATMLAQLVQSRPFLPQVKPEDYVEKMPEQDLTPEQLSAITGVFAHRISVLTGGPGVGKSFSTKTLLDLADAVGVTYELAAPTGKAAKRLSELTGRPAKTIHRLLKWNPYEKDFVHNAEDPLTSQMLVVDEASMVDLRLAHSLLQAVGSQQHVLFIGDKDQLPSVGAGKFLDDLLESNVIKTTQLTKIFRQASRSLIIQNSRRINQGKFPYNQNSHVEGVNEADVVKDFFLIPRKEDATTLRTTVDFVASRIPRWKHLDPVKDIQVYAPMRKGPVGLDVLNQALQKRLNPRGKHIGFKGFRVGDKIIQTKNNYDYDLMNGETAIIAKFDDEASTVDLLTTDDVLIPKMPLDELWSFLLAYAISIHRSQGSQAPAVVIPISKSHYVMLKRNLLYTAITRAEQLCVIVGHVKAVAMAVSRVDTSKRNTSLAERMQVAMQAGPATTTNQAQAALPPATPSDAEVANETGARSTEPQPAKSSPAGGSTTAPSAPGSQGLKPSVPLASKDPGPAPF